MESLVFYRGFLFNFPTCPSPLRRRPEGGALELSSLGYNLDPKSDHSCLKTAALDVK